MEGLLSNPVLIAVVGRLLLAVAFGVVGAYALVVGKRLYVSGVGLEEEGTKFVARREQVEVNVSLKTVGAAVLTTSVAWGFLAYLALPKKVTRTAGTSHETTASSDEREPIIEQLEALGYLSETVETVAAAEEAAEYAEGGEGTAAEAHSGEGTEAESSEDDGGDT